MQGLFETDSGRPAHSAHPTPSLRLVIWLLLFLSSCGQQTPVHKSESHRGREVPETVSLVGTLAPPTEAALPHTRQLAGSSSEIGRGLDYENDQVRNVPWSIHLLKIDRSRRDLSFATTLGRGGILGLGPLTQQIEALPADLGTPIAAINGDFYRTEQEPYAGDPRGLQIMRGELVSGPIGKTTFWIDPDGNPHLENVSSRFQVRWPDGTSVPFGLNEERRSNEAVLYTPRAAPSTHATGGRELILVRHGQEPWVPLRAGQTYTAEVRQTHEGGNTKLANDIVVLSIGPTLLARVPAVNPGELLEISTSTAPDLGNVQIALGGSPVLLHDGKVQSTYTNKAQERHPRSAMGWNDSHFFFIEVDGRQHGFSVGMTLPELGAYLARQGCREAMNLDGGGSAEMWIEGEIVNRPCFGYERNTANALVLVRKAELARH
jgi:hypothetical protein